MRFSLKWILAGMAYAAVAAAALTQDTRVYADILWAATLVTFAFAVVAACFARGPRQIAAASFVVFSGCYLLCLHFAAESVPTSNVLLAWRVGEKANVPAWPPNTYYATRATTGLQSTKEPLGSDASATVRALERNLERNLLQIRIRRDAMQAAAARSTQFDLSAYLRAGNALATMSFGLLGCLLAPLALKAAKPNAVAPPRPTAANALDPSE